MGRGWKILIGALFLFAIGLSVNALLTDSETKAAKVTVPGGRILHLPGGDLQIVDRGPRGASPIVLIHCFTCAIDWWDRMMPLLDRTHRVVALDLLGFGGSEKPSSGYSMEAQAAVVAQALSRLGVRHATVVGHSLGGTVATALATRPGDLVERLVIIDQAPDDSFGPGLPFTADLTFTPVLGQALWQLTPDFAIKEGLGAAFAPGYDVPDAFVEDFHRMTYTSYAESPREEESYTRATPLDSRIQSAGVPLLAIFGAEDQIYDARKALRAYAAVPGAQTHLIRGSGHSPNVEKPAQTAALVLGFAARGVMGTNHGIEGRVGGPHPRFSPHR